MSPNPKILIREILGILDSGDSGKDGVRTAEEYRAYCSILQDRIDRFLELTEAGYTFAALDVVRSHPPLLAAIDRIRFPREQDWIEFTSRRGLPTFHGFRAEQIERIRLLSSQGFEEQPSGYRAYRKAMIQKDFAAAKEALDALLQQHPNDPNAQSELHKIRKRDWERDMENLAQTLEQGDKDSLSRQVEGVRKSGHAERFSSPVWDQALAALEAQTKDHDSGKIQHLLSRVQVIRRVGFWLDAAPLIKDLKSVIEAPDVNTLPPEIHHELADHLKWFAAEELKDKESARLQLLCEQMEARLQPDNLQEAMKPLNRASLRTFRSTLEEDWINFQRTAPSHASELQDPVNAALGAIDQRISDLRPAPRQRKPFRIPRWTLVSPAILLLLAATGAPTWVLWTENRLAKAMDLAREETRARETSDLINKFDTFSSSPIRKWVPVTNRAAVKKADESREWIQEQRGRRQNSERLRNESEALLGEFKPSSISIIEDNLSSARLLAENLAVDWRQGEIRAIDQILDKYQRTKSDYIDSVRRSTLQEIEPLRQLLRGPLAWSSPDPKEIQQHIDRGKSLITDLEIIFSERQISRILPDLDEELSELAARVGQVEAICRRFFLLETNLRNVQSVEDYFDRIEALAEMPFEQFPLCVAARNILPFRARIQDPLPHLFMPGDEIGWNHFVSHADTPVMIPKPSEREAHLFTRLSGYEPLNSVYRYQVFSYENGAPAEAAKTIFTLFQADVETIDLPSSTRLLQTVQVFDPERKADMPFTNEVFICTTDTEGNPIDGEFLVVESLTPESIYYAKLRDLAGFDPQSGDFQRSLLATLDDVCGEPDIHPLFKAFLAQEILGYMSIRPYDWGLNFSPLASIHFQRVRNLTGRIGPFAWLNRSDHENLGNSLNALFEEMSPFSYHAQGIAMRKLLLESLQQPIEYSGYADLEGEAILSDRSSFQNRLFGLDYEGEIHALFSIQRARRATEILTSPYSLTPLLRFRDSPETILTRITASEGLDLSVEPHRTLLPSLFLPSIRSPL